MKKYTRYTKEILEPIVTSSQSYAECLRKLGLIVAGGNYKNLQKNIDLFRLSTDHMHHQAHNKGLELKRFDELIGRSQIKKRLIKERGQTCEGCGLGLWREQPIPLELDHVDGNNRDNTRSNLRLLCPNCHAQTPTWRRRK